MTIAVTARATRVGTHTNVATVTGGGGRETNPADNVTTRSRSCRLRSAPDGEAPAAAACVPDADRLAEDDQGGRQARPGQREGHRRPKRVKGTKVAIFGAGVRKTGRSNPNGMAVIRINPKKAGLITITAIETNQRVCGPKRIGVVGVFLPPLTG